jgi:hypothetical protein
LYASPARTVVAVGAHYVAKYGFGVKIPEADILIWMEQSTNIRVPKLYSVYRRTSPLSGDEHVCIIMERINGFKLKDIWRGFNATQNGAHVAWLREYLLKLQSIQRLDHDTPFCNPTGGPLLLDKLFIEPESIDRGPFSTRAILSRAWPTRPKGGGKCLFPL